MHSDNSWMKIQKYSENVSYWKNLLSDYNWDKLFYNIDTLHYESKIDQFLYPRLIQIAAASKFSKLTSKYLNINSREYTFNPDWDSDVILRLFDMFASHLGLTPPKLPRISKRVDGKRFKTNLEEVEKIGLKTFIKKKNIFSYAITKPKEINYTVFNTYRSNEK